jgi:ABC-type multidrug transport system ATPase subunit
MTELGGGGRGIRVRGLKKSFGVFGVDQLVLKGIDVDVAPGEVVGLIGPNGAGKTTLMSCILGFLFPTEGEVIIDGRRSDDLSIRARTGFVPERMNFDRTVSGRAFLRYMARLANVSTPDDRVEELLARLELREAGEKRLSQYSRGMLQRIGLCQAILDMPDFLFLDEPTSGLDPNGVMLVRDVIAEERARGATILLNSHQLSEIEKVCDRVLFLSKGVISEDQVLRSEVTVPIAVTLLPGSYDADALGGVFGSRPEHNVLHLTVAREEEVADVVRRLVALGAGVLDVHRRSTDLEDIFRRSR